MLRFVLSVCVFSFWVLLSGCASQDAQPDVEVSVSAKDSVEAVGLADKPILSDSSGVDVPDFILDRQRVFSKPTGDDADSVFAALHSSKFELRAAAEDKELLNFYMRLSDRLRSPITIHNSGEVLR